MHGHPVRLVLDLRDAGRRGVHDHSRSGPSPSAASTIRRDTIAWLTRTTVSPGCSSRSPRTRRPPARPRPRASRRPAGHALGSVRHVSTGVPAAVPHRPGSGLPTRRRPSRGRPARSAPVAVGLAISSAEAPGPLERARVDRVIRSPARARATASPGCWPRVPSAGRHGSREARVSRVDVQSRPCANGKEAHALFTTCPVHNLGRASHEPSAKIFWAARTPAPKSTGSPRSARICSRAARRDDHVELGGIAHVTKAEELALHLGLPARDRDVVDLRVSSHDRLAVDARRRHHGGQGRARRRLGEELEPESLAAGASGAGQPVMAAGTRCRGPRRPACAAPRAGRA